MNITDKLNVIYNDTKNLTSGMYHNLLWQVMVNRSTEGRGAFTHLHDGQLVIAYPDGGYIPTGVQLIGKDQRQSLCDRLNADIFGLLPDGAFAIVAQSMRKPAKKGRAK